MKTLSQIIHAIGGRKAHAECSDRDSFRCWVCAGESSRGMIREDWTGANFTGQNRVRCPDSIHVCESCVIVMAGKPPNTERFYSHLVEGASHVRVNKGGKPAIRAFLRRAHAAEWGAAIADSGQKHVIPWTPVNPAGATGRVMFEETLVILPSSEQGWSLLDEMTDLLTRGATKEEVGRGDYGSGSYQRCASAIFGFELQRRSERASPWFELALWLAQRDEPAVAKRMEEEKTALAAKREFWKRAEKAKKEVSDVGRGGKGKTSDVDGGGAARGAQRVPPNAERKHPQALGSDPGSDARGGADHVDSGGVDNGGGEDAAPRRSQLALF